jgi:Ca-activated chloride channel family protein
MKFLVVGLLSVLSAVPVWTQEVAQDEVVKVKTTLVNVPVIVSDRNGRYIPGLQAGDFTLLQDGVAQGISFFAAEEEPLNVALLLDTSKSARDVLGKIKDAAKDFIKLLQPADRALVMSFDYRVNVHSLLTSDRKVLEKAVKSVEIGEYVGTVMREAVQDAVRRQFAGVRGRKAVILLTDGKDHGSNVTKSGLLNMLEESDTMIYTVFYETKPNSGMRGLFGRRGGDIFRGRFPRRRGGPDPDVINQRRGELNENAAEYLAAMSDLTAGRFYRQEVTDLKKTFELIVDELRKQYRLGYYPLSVNADGQAHVIKVQVNRPDVAVRSRRTYRP